MKNKNEIESDLLTIIKKSISIKSIDIKKETPLIGGELIDSMKLVELCLTLEEKAAVLGFEFDWTSSAAMSKSRGMFRTVGSLIEEFINQFEAKK
tara:strand:- start:1207 stop:1491 length:285 start_codon:yes stop_codon:yes gene_type:complete